MAIDFAQLLGLRQDPTDPFKNRGVFQMDPTMNQSSIPQGNPLDPSTMSVAPVPVPVDPMTQTQGEPIVVPGNRNIPVQEPGYPESFKGNREVLQAAMDSLNSTGQAVRSDPQRTGMFGIKGTLRDILGTLGDAFLVQGGAQAVYAPRRQQERMADAMAGFSAGDPASLQSSMERLSAAGFGKEAMGLFEAASQAQARQAAAQTAQQSAESQAGDRRWGNIKDARNAIARLFASSQAIKNPLLADTQAARIAQAAGVTLEDLGITANMTPEERAMYATGDMTVNQQMQVPFTERRVATGERNAQTAANRPGPQPRATPNPTEASIAAPLLAKVARGIPLTPGEQDALDRTAPAPSSTGRRGSTPLRAAPGGTAAPGAAPGWSVPRRVN